MSGKASAEGRADQKSVRAQSRDDAQKLKDHVNMRASARLRAEVHAEVAPSAAALRNADKPASMRRRVNVIQEAYDASRCESDGA